SFIKSDALNEIKTKIFLPAFTGELTPQKVVDILLNGIQEIKNRFKVPENFYVTATGKTKHTTNSVIPINRRKKDTKLKVNVNYQGKSLDPALLVWSDVVDITGLSASLDLTSFDNSKEFT